MLPGDLAEMLTAHTSWVPTAPFCPLWLYSSRAGGIPLWVDAWVRQVEKQITDSELPASVSCFYCIDGRNKIQLHFASSEPNI